jgi:hypothetical protein
MCFDRARPLGFWGLGRSLRSRSVTPRPARVQRLASAELTRNLTMVSKTRAEASVEIVGTGFGVCDLERCDVLCLHMNVAS